MTSVKTNQRPCATRGCRHWHNESDFNCDTPSLIESCASFESELTPVEKELLRMLESRKPLWPFDKAIDTAYVRKLYALYGQEINLVEKFFLWEDYYTSKKGGTGTLARARTGVSAPPMSNPRLAFHKWCIKGVELKKRYTKNYPPFPPKGRSGTEIQTAPGIPFKGINADGGSQYLPNSNLRKSVKSVDSVPVSGSINALAAGIAKDKSADLSSPRRRGSSSPGQQAPDRVKKILAEAVMNSGLVKPQPTQEELEARRQAQLQMAREIKGARNDG